MPRYVLLRHEMPPGSARGSHWDFMLEREGDLLTWALEMLPSAWLMQLGLPHDHASDEVAALRLGDHRLAYLDYEGPVSGDRGSVKRVAAGEFEFVQSRDGGLVARLWGDVSGSLQLTNTGGEADKWLLNAIR